MGIDWKSKVVLITGGTGSFGQQFVQTMLKTRLPKKLIVFSRDEMKQYEMKQKLHDPERRVRFFIGDVRDADRLHRAFENVDIIVHAAALKIVPTAEYNPFEAVKTNIIGAENVINVAIDNGVEKVLALSTDKAANPVNLYGATKLCAEKMFVAGNNYSPLGTKFSVVRYGNVFGSRGSVVPFFKECRVKGEVPITDERMTRFWITLPQGVDFVIQSLEEMVGGEIFIPKLPSIRITDLAKAVCPGCRQKVVGIRPGEKLHEVLIASDDGPFTYEFKDRYITYPKVISQTRKDLPKPLGPDFEGYRSDGQEWQLSVPELETMINEEETKNEENSIWAAMDRSV
ncbi:MAG: UDP-N-acetylglucosamine 4,6-dehydratase (inverting) [Candidatus Omnitrophica bacterium]|nr:UDP-N-acetylglucosamine 4,6-dehydratase (inverting) [Candidatus Omnitrophota bacterium]